MAWSTVMVTDADSYHQFLPPDSHDGEALSPTHPKANGPKPLRGDPDLPFPTDPERIRGLLAKLVEPTHEPLWFYRIRGTGTAVEQAQSVGYKTPENVEVMHQLGMQLPERAEFFKGLGLERERPYHDAVVAYAKELHRRGMMVSVYVGGTMFTEYFFKEVPEAVNWARVDQAGNQVTYAAYQLNRWFPCLNNPDYRRYMKRVLDVAVQEIEADEIFFDNQILRNEPRSCRCAHCVRHLRETIRKRYSLAECEERYGLAEHPDSVPPQWSQANKPWRLDRITAPNIQDWIDHRVAMVLEFYQEMAAHVKAQSPTTAVGMNIKGIHGHNRAFNHGICHGAASGVMDFSCIDGYKPGIKDGCVVSEVRFWKSAHSTHIAVVDDNRHELPTVENAVYGYRKFIPGHGWLGDMGNCTVFTPVAQFLRGNQRLFLDRAHLRDIAVLRYEPATRYNCAKLPEQIMPFEQTLAVEKLPWGIIFDRQREALDEFRIIALPEIVCLSDAWLDRLDAFMRAGGGVIASGGAASANEWNRSRTPRHALERWLGHAPKGTYACVPVGRGRFVYVPEWDVAQRWSIEDWHEIPLAVKPLKDRPLLLRAIADATAGIPLSHRASGNDAVFIEGIVPEAGRQAGVDLHLINYNPADTSPMLELRVALPEGVTRAEGEHVAADVAGAPRRRLDVRIEGREAVLSVPTPGIYAVVFVRFAR